MTDDAETDREFAYGFITVIAGLDADVVGNDGTVGNVGSAGTVGNVTDGIVGNVGTVGSVGKGGVPVDTGGVTTFGVYCWYGC